MKILLISANEYEYDGRLREQVKLADMLGETFLISRSAEDRQIDERHIICADGGGYLGFVRFCFAAAKKLGHFDVVWADNRKGIIPAYYIAKHNKNAVLVQDIRELYILSETKHIAGKIGCLIELLYNRRFDVAICANEERAKIMRELYNLKDEPIIFENNRKLDGGGSGSAKHGEEQQMLMRHKWKLISTAGCSINRGTLDVVRAVLNMGNDYALFLVGDSDEMDRRTIEEQVNTSSCKNVYILDKMLPAELKCLIDAVDIGVVIYHNRDTNNKYCASGKIYEFLYENKPVICSDNPPLKSICEKTGVGLAGGNYTDMINEITSNYSTYCHAVSAYISSHSTEDCLAQTAAVLREKLYACSKLLK